MKPLTKLAVVAVSGVVLFKLIASIVIPLLAMALGLVSSLLKLAFMAALIYFIYSFVKKREEELSSDGEIVVEVEEFESKERSGGK